MLCDRCLDEGSLFRSFSYPPSGSEGSKESATVCWRHVASKQSRQHRSFIKSTDRAKVDSRRQLNFMNRNNCWRRLNISRIPDEWCASSLGLGTTPLQPLEKYSHGVINAIGFLKIYSERCSNIIILRCLEIAYILRAYLHKKQTWRFTRFWIFENDVIVLITICLYAKKYQHLVNGKCPQMTWLFGDVHHVTMCHVHRHGY